MGSNQDKVIRFGVGSRGGLCSSVYRIWGADGAKSSTRPSDLYLSARALGGTFKTSLHESGNWRTGFTNSASDTGILDEGQDRKKIGWQRPPEWQPGITWAYCIMFPSSELRPGLAEGRVGEDVTWINDPGPGKVVQVDVLLAKPTIDFLNLHYPAMQDLKVLDAFKLPNREGVLVVSRIIDETPEMSAQLQEAKQRILALAVGEGSDLSSNTLRTVLWVEKENGLRGLIDAAIAGR